MGHAAGEADQLAAMVDRQAQRDVVQVAAGDVGVVGHQDVAGGDAVGPEMRQLGPQGLGHAADEHRQAEADGDRLALGGEQPDGEVERLVDDHVVGGAHQVGLHLFAHRHDAVADQLGRHRVRRIRRRRHRPARIYAARAPANRGAAGRAAGHPPPDLPPSRGRSERRRASASRALTPPPGKGQATSHRPPTTIHSRHAAG